jgi:lipopolysaccharide exporter
MQDVRSKMARGAIWMVLFKIIDRGLGFASTLVLARLLTPENFGIVGMATSLIVFLELLGAFGFDMALIQRADATRAHYDTAWTFSVIFGCALAALMAAFSYPLSLYYHQPVLVYVVCALALGSLLQGFNNVGVVAFRKDMEFHKEFRFLISKRLATIPVTIILAVWLRNYWALVSGMVLGRAIDLFLSYRFHPYRPRFDLSAAGDLFHFSKWLLLLNVLQFMRDRAPDFVIGRLSGAKSLGLFSLSYELANMPGTELVAPINRAVYPAYVKIAGDADALRREYLSVMALISLLAIPAVAGVAATANLIVPLALGPNWLDAIPILQVLAFFGISQVMLSNAYALFLALGRGSIFARLNGAYVGLLIVLLVVLVRRNGLAGAAMAYLIAALTMLPIAFATIVRMLRLPTWSLLRELWRPLTAAALMYFVVERYCAGWDPSRGAAADDLPQLLARLMGAVAIGFALYVAAIGALWWLAGKPTSAESAVLGKLGPAWDKVMRKVGWAGG